MLKNIIKLFNLFSNKELFFFLVIIFLLILISLLELISISSIPIFANYYFKKDNSILINEEYFKWLNTNISIEFLSLLIISIFMFVTIVYISS